MKRLICYVTRDPVNASLAHRADLPADVAIVHSDSEDGLPNTPLSGLVFDLDHLWPGDRERVVNELSASPPAQPVIVHSYSIDHEQAADLQLQGVGVVEQLDEGIFQRLAGGDAARRKAA